MSTVLMAGFGRADITPPVGIELCGFGWNLERKSTGVYEPLFANVMVWRHGGMQGAILSCDIIAIGKIWSRQIRQRIEQECGIPYDNIMLCCTHTHSGPTTMELIGWGEMDHAYMDTLPDRITQGVKMASMNMAETTVEYGETQASGISYNRESHTKTNPGGLTDPTLKVIKLLQGDTMAGFMVHYSCHPVVMCEATSLISGDFIGVAMNKLMAQYNATGLFIQGSIGDQNPVFCHENQETSLINLKVLSNRFADLVEGALTDTESLPLDADSVRIKRLDIKLPQLVIEQSVILRNMLLIADIYKHYDNLPKAVQRRVRFERDVLEKNWARYSQSPLDEFQTEIQALRFGNLLILAHPSELFYSYHEEILKRLSGYKVLVAGITNDAIGYIPTPDKYDVSERKYSYPAWFTPFMLGEFPYRSDTGEILSDALVELGTSL